MKKTFWFLFCGLEFFSILEILGLGFSAPVGSAFQGRCVLAPTELSVEHFLLLGALKHLSCPHHHPINHRLGVWGKTGFDYLVFFFKGGSRHCDLTP